jgi:hypothetical protein
MPGSLSTLGKVETLLRETDINTTRLSALCFLYGIDGCSEASLSRALKGGRLSAETDKDLRQLVLKIEQLIASARPIQLSFREPEKIKQWLDDLTAGKLWFAVVDGIGEVPAT